MTTPSKCPHCGAPAVESDGNARYECGTKYFGPDYVADASTLVSRECNRREIARLHRVLWRFMGRTPYDSMGLCVFCKAPQEHVASCPWAEARGILKETT